MPEEEGTEEGKMRKRVVKKQARVEAEGFTQRRVRRFLDEE